MLMTDQKGSKGVSEKGFEPTPPFGDQNTQPSASREGFYP